MYCYGDIATKEEALCQMIIGMDKDWSELQRRHCEILQNQPISFYPASK